MSFPNLHPLIIHFPIVLWLTGWLFSLVEFIFPGKWSLTRSATVLYGLAGISAVVAWLTGRQAADTQWIPPDAQTAVSTHADWGLITMITMVLTGAGMVLLYRTGRLNQRRFAGMGVLMTGLVALLIAVTADRGGRLVFEHGIGTRTVEEQLSSNTATGMDTEQAVLLRYPRGGWRWQSGRDSRSSLQTVFTTELPAENVRVDTTLIILMGDSAAKQTLPLIYPEELKDVQVSARIYSADFRGTIELVQHVRSSTEYDFLRVDDSRVILGRKNGDGSEDHFATASLPDRTGWIELSVAGAGRHFRGYAAGTLIVHGHGEASPPGKTGLILKGQGQIRIDWLQAQPLDGEH